VNDDLGLFTDPDAPAGDEDERSRRKAIRRARAKRKRTILWVVVAMVLAVGGVGAYYGYQTLSGIGSFDDYSGSGESDVVIEVKDGDPVGAIATTLKDQGVVASARAFTQAGVNDNRLTSIQPGFYLMKTKMSGAFAVARMVDPQAKVPGLDLKGGVTLHDITGGDGKVVKGLLSQLSDASCVKIGGKQTCVSVDDLRKAAETTDPAALGVPDWALADVSKAPAANRLEGLIVRGVYQIKPGADANALLKDLITTSAMKLQGYGIPGATAQTGFRPYEVLVLAGLVEKEGIEKDFGKISRVLYNRLAVGQMLQLDSTVNYKLDKPRITTSDEDRARAGAYNTYQTVGLPPTPIGAPSREAVEAALKPHDGKWLYFVKCQKDGTSCFNEDFTAHDATQKKAQAEGVF
jgi:UPF0755 protein